VLDGLVAGVDPSTTVAYCTRNLGTPWASLGHMGRLLASTPRLWLASRWVPRATMELLARQLQGVSGDRFEVLCSELTEACLRGRLLVALRGLVARQREDGNGTVLVTTAFEPVARRVAAMVSADAAVANRLELSGEQFTGRLLLPAVVSGAMVTAVRGDAAVRGLQLKQCRALVGSLGELGLLGAVGQPCIIGGDPGLERLALQSGWPQMRLGVVA
jgi:phosphoserine phosphatase